MDAKKCPNTISQFVFLGLRRAGQRDDFGDRAVFRCFNVEGEGGFHGNFHVEAQRWRCKQSHCGHNNRHFHHVADVINYNNRLEEKQLWTDIYICNYLCFALCNLQQPDVTINLLLSLQQVYPTRGVLWKSECNQICLMRSWNGVEAHRLCDDSLQRNNQNKI